MKVGDKITANCKALWEAKGKWDYVQNDEYICFLTYQEVGNLENQFSVRSDDFGILCADEDVCKIVSIENNKIGLVYDSTTESPVFYLSNEEFAIISK